MSGAPSSAVPRIHALAVLPLSGAFPLYPQLTEVKSSAVKAAFTGVGGVEKVRKELMAYFTSVLNGDVLAAEVLLLHMLSRVYVGTANLLAVTRGLC